MLTRKCQQTVLILLNENDSNIKITIAQQIESQKQFVTHNEIENIWKGYLYDTVGGEILNSEKKFWVDMYVAKHLHITKIEASLTGRKIGETFSLPLILNADGVRVTILQHNGKQLSCIIVKP